MPDLCMMVPENWTIPVTAAAGADSVWQWAWLLLILVVVISFFSEVVSDRRVPSFQGGDPWAQFSTSSRPWPLNVEVAYSLVLLDGVGRGTTWLLDKVNVVVGQYLTGTERLFPILRALHIQDQEILGEHLLLMWEERYGAYSISQISPAPAVVVFRQGVDSFLTKPFTVVADASAGEPWEGLADGIVRPGSDRVVLGAGRKYALILQPGDVVETGSTVMQLRKSDPPVQSPPAPAA